MRVIAWVVAMIVGPVMAKADEAGDFSYYVLALSWSPSFCSVEDSEQCDDGHGWILHGLWPQNERGWPEYCPSVETPPSRSQTRAMEDIMGSDGLAWHQWRKHGVCTGMSAAGYFTASREAYNAVNFPPVLEALDQAVRLPAAVIEEAFLEANPGWDPDMLTITCRDGLIREARLCLTRDFEPVVCGADVRRDCPLDNALFPPMD